MRVGRAPAVSHRPAAGVRGANGVGGQTHKEFLTRTLIPNTRYGHETFGFQSSNIPEGLFFQIQMRRI